MLPSLHLQGWPSPHEVPCASRRCTHRPALGGTCVSAAAAAHVRQWQVLLQERGHVHWRVDPALPPAACHARGGQEGPAQEEGRRARGAYRASPACAPWQRWAWMGGKGGGSPNQHDHLGVRAPVLCARVCGIARAHTTTCRHVRGGGLQLHGRVCGGRHHRAGQAHVRQRRLLPGRCGLAGESRGDGRGCGGADGP